MGAGTPDLLTLPVVFLPEATDQIEAIGDYLAEQASTDIARSFTSRLATRCQKIGGLPFGGTPRDELRPGLRSVPFEDAATIFYRVAEGEVLIAAILYRARDAGAYFKTSN